MRRIHAAAIPFVATVAIAVPAGWHALDADLRADGKHVRPLQQSVEIDGARVTLDVDRAVVQIGDPVTATLRAYGPPGKHVAVDVLALEGGTSIGARIESPPAFLDRESIVLSASPGGGAPVATRIRLGEHAGGFGLRSSFRILAVAHGTKARFMVGEELRAAVVGVLGGSRDGLGIAIAHDGEIRAGAYFNVAVRITNTSKQALRMPYVRVGTRVDGRGTLDYNSEGGLIDPVDTVDDTGYDDHAAPFKPGDTIERKFTLEAPADAKQLAVIVDASASLPQTKDDAYDEIGGWPSVDGLDVATFAVEPGNPNVADNE